MRYSDFQQSQWSYLGLGTVKIGRNQAVKYPESFEIPDDKAVLNLLAKAHDLGVNVLDTAPAYGESEIRLGQLLKGQRDHWHIVSKAGEIFEKGHSHYDFSRQHIQGSVERSLNRLKTDYLDMLLIHSDGQDQKIIVEDGVFETLAAIKKSGKIRAYGMSVKTVEGGLLTLQQADAVMVTLNPGDTSCAAVVKAAENTDKAVLIKKAFASGHVYAGEKPLNAKEIFDFLKNYPAITSVIAGTINPSHLQDNAKACEG